MTLPHPLQYEIMSLRWKSLPRWQKQNKYIRSGYRKASYSYYRSAKDIAGWHNETVNIWSHLFGAITFSLFLIQFLASLCHSSTISSPTTAEKS